MELLSDPATWIGLATLVLLEIVLGIDNLIFIAILAEKLPPHQRDKARVIGLSLALLMRLMLLSVISWLVTLTTPLFSMFGFSFSGRDLILLLGGLFLLFKATTELHERLEGVTHKGPATAVYASFSVVVAQIVVLDAVFSLDAVITAVGMVNHLPVMMAAVVISIGVMLLASKPLTRFVNAHPTVVVLCLSFLLMIGLSLVAEGLGFHLPKGYLYAAIGFSVMIETFNQLAKRNLAREEARIPLRDRTAEAVLRLLGGRPAPEMAAAAPAGGSVAAASAFAPEERSMVGGVLTLAERDVRSIMTPRSDISWIDLNEAPDVIRDKLLAAPHAMFPVCRGSLDEIVGVARAKDLLADLLRFGHIDEQASLRAPIYVPDSTIAIKLIETLRHARGQIALVSDEFGLFKGVVSPIDILEAIAGEFPDEDETLEIQPAGPGKWTVSGSVDLHQLEQALHTEGLLSEDGSYSSLGGYLLANFGYMPKVDEALIHENFEFRITGIDERRITTVQIHRLEPPRPSEPAAE
ncbi:TerC family protein [Pseudothauera nasutitermitis]|uniref:TerC family protein n=1 Tax=Pseudothauera nasutitermitis TaxID=2565930 RepID=A0A4S4ATI9_9RHOO|nr:TerC family protein [Pseudothauera nasutitermitis]